MKALSVIITLLILFMPENSAATKYFYIDFEGQSCSNAVADGGIVDNCCIDYGVSSNSPYYRCSLFDKPSGNIYIEWITNTILADAGTAFYNDNCGGVAHALSTNGTTYYLSAFVRFERIEGLSIWHDSSAEENSFDKLIEVGGSGFRWGMYSGWPQGRYTAVPGKFTFMAWFGQAVAIPDGTCGDNGSDNIAANVAPYSINNPYLADYEKWYAVVLSVTPKTDNTGDVKMWINGVKIIDKQSCRTSMADPTINRIVMNGTIAQPDYDAPPHKRQADRIMLTDNWQDVVDGGYLRDPENIDSGDASSQDRSNACFISTAAFDSDVDPHVEILRNFKDQILTHTYLGRAFVSFYYKVSPGIADFIAKHEMLKTIVRWCLYPLVGLSWMTLELGAIPTLGLILILMILTGKAIAVYFRNARHTN